MADRTGELAGRRALVTGGAGHIGAGVSDALAERGARVAIHYHRREDRAVALADRLRSTEFTPPIIQGDVAAAAGDIFNEARARLGGIDILVNCAGGYLNQPLLESTAEQWDQLMRTDAGGTFEMIRQAAPDMVERRWGRIVNFSSIAGQRYVEGEGVYGAVKASVEMFTRAFAVELGPFGVTVNGVAPGAVGAEDASGEHDAAASDFEHVPNRRAALVGEIAALVCHLASDAGGHVNGQVLNADGGLTARLPPVR